MGMFFWLLDKCPVCGALHDDGMLIQTEDPKDTVFVCPDCLDDYLRDDEE